MRFHIPRFASCTRESRLLQLQIQMEIDRARYAKILLTLIDRVSRKLSEQMMRVVRIDIIADKFKSPLERAHDTIIVEHRKTPFPFVHVSF